MASGRCRAGEHWAQAEMHHFCGCDEEEITQDALNHFLPVAGDILGRFPICLVKKRPARMMLEMFLPVCGQAVTENKRGSPCADAVVDELVLPVEMPVCRFMNDTGKILLENERYG